jgi:polyisoprenoid-binding protein YceI
MTEQALSAPDDLLLSQARWHLDPWHTGVYFRALNRGAGWIRGRFNRVSGTVEVTDDVVRPRVDVTIDLTSVSTGVARRDDHLRSSDFLDTDRHPRAHYTAARFERTATDAGLLHGDLTIHGQTRPVTLTVSWKGTAPDPFSEVNGTHLAFSARVDLSLAEFGIRPRLLPGMTVVSVGDRVGLSIEAVLLPYDPTAMLQNIPVD